MTQIGLRSPISMAQRKQLQAGDSVLLSGTVYIARDAAHKRLLALLEEGKPLPFEVNGASIYYAGPCPAAPGRIIGSCGPTTSSRMDPYTPKMLELGLVCMIGKGPRSDEVKAAMRKQAAIYLAAAGGAGALIARSIRKAQVVAFEELGPEAVYRIEVENLPLIVAIDASGNDQYELGAQKWRR